MHSICKVGDLKAVKRMFKRANRKSAGVLADYLAPALKEATDPAVGPWIVEKVITSPNKYSRISGVEAVGALRVEQARGPLLELLEKKGRDIHLRYEILRSLGQIGGEGVWDLMEKGAWDEDWRVRLAVADVMLIHYRDAKAIALMRDLLRDKRPIVREVAAIAAGTHKAEALVKELVLLMREGNLRAKQKSYEAMKAISGQDFGYAPDVWAKWLSDKKKGKLTQTGEFKGDRERISVGTYYKFKIFSDRVLFIVDVSGSMQWPDSDPNRIKVAKRELVKAIKSLNDKTLFNMATFAGHVSMWKDDGEVPATEENKKTALRWINRSLLPRGPTNTYAALMEGLEKNPEVDTVYFLSDGIPSTGAYEVPEEILIKLRYANRFRKVIFHTIAVVLGRPAIEKAEKYEDPDEMAAFMRMIADWNGGTCLELRKPYLNLRDDD
jgi:hypothetical protein